MEVFVANSRAQFLEFSSHWIEFFTTKFPECEETKDCKIFLDSVVKNSTEKLTEQIQMWRTNIMTPLKKTKYSKAIERITNKQAVIYHALCYQDVIALKENMTSGIVQRVDLFEKYNSLSDADRASVWRFMQKISIAAFEALEETPPVVPSRTEISENIRARKEKTTDESPSMSKAFATHVNGMCKHLGQKPVLENADDALIKKWMTRWHTFSKDTTNEKKNTVLCQQEDPAVLAKLVAAFPEFETLSADTVTAQIWKNINQLNGFSAVTENIPTKMMGRIEDMASRLADDIVSGKTDMASVNLHDIGQQVLAGCEEADMSQFANNIEDLLPVLQNFQKQ